MSRLACRLACVLVALVVVLTARAASAQNPRQVVVGDFEGERAEVVRDALLQGLAGHDEIRLVSLSHTRKLAQRLDADLGDAVGVKKVASSLGLAAFVDGKIESGKQWTATIRVRAGIDGEVSESVRFSARSDKALIAKLRKTAWKQLAPALKDAEASKAGGGGHQIVVGSFSGPKAAAVRGTVVKSLKKGKGISVVADKKVKETGITLEKKSSDEDYAGVAAATGANALLEGTVATRGRAVAVEIAVRSGADGKIVDRITFEPGAMRAVQQAIEKTLVSELAQPLTKTAGPSAPEEEVPAATAADLEETDERDDEDGDDQPKRGPGEPSEKPSPLEIGGGIRAMSRNFRYTDDLFDSLRSYKLGVAPAAFVWVRWYPIAHVQGGPLAHLGLTGGYEQGFALASRAPDGTELGTSTREWWLGLRYRIPVDRHELGVVVAYGKHSFEIDDDPNDPFVPDVDYGWVRLGFDGRVRVSRVVLGAQLGYRHLTDTGELGGATWFPNLSGGALDAGLLAGYEIVDGVDLLAGFDFRRYFFSMNSEPGDARVAGGALDEYIAGWGGLAFRLPGEAKAGGGAASLSTEASSDGD
jgi:TolB-like protein